MFTHEKINSKIATKNKLANENGINTFQHKCMSWSTLNLGKVHLNHIITKIRNKALEKIQKIPHRGPSKNSHVSGKILKSLIGESHPPRNRTDAKILTINILAYSLRKNIAHLNPEYSVIQPATNSDSASGISNGVLFVSAKPDIKNIKKARNVNGL
tara:strand:+ start:89 stop:559 length:471 start_codon:yes stop_codon:yes gene_type:complete